MAYRDGHTYEGQFKNWIKSGRGKMTYRNGDLYLGEWEGDLGKGKITHKDGSSYEVFSSTQQQSLIINKRESSKVIRNMDLEHIPYLVEISTLECMRY